MRVRERGRVRMGVRVRVRGIDRDGQERRKERRDLYKDIRHVMFVD